MKIMFNYADGCCQMAQKRSKQSAELFGGFDKAFCFSRRHLDANYCEQNKFILERKRGAGLWVWKYHLALRLLDNDDILGKKVPEESYICYCDSDLYFTMSIDFAIECLQKDSHNQSVMIFRGWNWYEASSQTKRDAFILCDAEEDKYIKTTMRCGGFWLFKKDDAARDFFNTMSKYVLDPRIIVPPPNQPQYNIDSPLDNQMGKPNYPKFLRHAEDEAIITIAAKKYSLYPYRFPAITKEAENVRVSDNLQNGGWCSNAEAYTTLQYPELKENTSKYPQFLIYSQDTD